MNPEIQQTDLRHAKRRSDFLKYTVRRMLTYAVLLCALAMLTACGGGSSSSSTTTGGGTTASPPSAPNLTLTPQAIKNFFFTWTDVADETEYRLMENPDDVSGFTQVATSAADSTSIDFIVFLPLRINAMYLLEACNAAGCSQSNTVSVSDNLATSTGYFKASNTEDGDEFGWGVSLSADGKTLAVGAHFESSSAAGIGGDESDNAESTSGAVYIFTRDSGGTGWSQQAYIKASNPESGDDFGWVVSLSSDGNTLAVGAINEDSNALGVGGDQGSNAATDSGAVYVFTRSGTTWSQQAYIKASNTGNGDLFGWTVSLSDDGDTLAVGAFAEDSNAMGIGGAQGDNSAGNSGAVYVFTRSGVTWSQEAYIKASNTNASDFFWYDREFV